MAQLLNQSKNIVLAEEVEIAAHFWARLKGLLGREDLSPGLVLWIHQCNSIHTWFMKFPIDVIFADKNLKICAVFPNIEPWQFIFPVHRASSVFEFTAGDLKKKNLEVGDQLYVGD